MNHGYYDVLNKHTPKSKIRGSLQLISGKLPLTLDLGVYLLNTLNIHELYTYYILTSES